MIIANLWCENCTCGKVGNSRNFQLELEDDEDRDNILCPIDDKSPLKYMGEVLTSAFIDKGKHAKGRTSKEKRERANADFKKNTLPTLPAFERKHFEKKFNDQKAGKRRDY